MGTHYKGKASEIRALNAFIPLLRAARSLQALSVSWLAEHELTEPQFAVLEMLHHLGPLAQCQIARKVLCTPGNLTSVLDRLEKRGLIHRTRNEDDRRRVTTTLSAEGKALMTRIFPAHAARIAQAMSVLSGIELSQLRELSRKLGLGVERLLAERHAGTHSSEKFGESL